MEFVVQVLVAALIVMPVVTLAATVYLARLAKETVHPPRLLVMLVIWAFISLVTHTYLAALTVNSRFLGNVNPPALVPVTLLSLIAPMAMINVIAYVLWHAGVEAERDAARETKRDEADAAREVRRDAADAAREQTRDDADVVREERHEDEHAQEGRPNGN
jgi:hypothetical protein